MSYKDALADFIAFKSSRLTPKVEPQSPEPVQNGSAQVSNYPTKIMLESIPPEVGVRPHVPNKFTVPVNALSRGRDVSASIQATGPVFC